MSGEILLIEIFVKGNHKKNLVTAGVYKDGECCFFRSSGTVDMTRNQCEWEAIIYAMNLVKDMGEEKVKIKTDSKLVYRQLNYIYKIKDKQLKQKYFRWNRQKNILRDFDIDYEYVGKDINPARRYNKEMIK
jgi:ribonuclease HI